MIPLGKQIQTSLRLISVSLSNVLYCIYDESVVSRCTLYLNKILFTLTEKYTLKPLFLLFNIQELDFILLLLKYVPFWHQTNLTVVVLHYTHHIEMA